MNKLVFVFLLILCLFGCSFSNKKEIHPFSIEYAKTPKVGENYMGKIAIKLDLDTLKLNKKDTRITLFYLGKFKKQYNISDLEKKHSELDTFGFMKNNNDTIYFNYKFKNIGTYYLEGYIEDIAMLENSEDTTKVRMVSNLIKVSEQVNVIK